MFAKIVFLHNFSIVCICNYITYNAKKRTNCFTTRFPHKYANQLEQNCVEKFGCKIGKQKIVFIPNFSKTYTLTERQNPLPLLLCMSIWYGNKPSQLCQYETTDTKRISEGI